MENQKPMTLLSLECTMGFMEANQRIWLVARCPSLCGVHQSVPLTVKHLKIDEKCFVLNNCKYEFNSKAEKPKPEPYKFDALKFQSISSPLACKMPPKEEEKIVRSKRTTTVPARYQGGAPVVTKRGTLPKAQPSALDFHIKTCGNAQYAPIAELHLVPQSSVYPDESFPPSNKKLRIDTEQQLFGPDGISVDFKLSQISNNHMIHSKSFKNVSIEDLMSILIRNVLPRKIDARNLEIKKLPALPVNVKFRIHNLNSTSQGFDALQAHVLQNGSTFENAILEFATRHLRLMESPILHRFERLNLFVGPGRFEFAIAIQQLPNMKINVNNYTSHVGDIAQIARHWVEVNKSLGAKLTINLNGDMIDSWVAMIMNRLPALLGSEWKMLGSTKCATLRIGGDKELVIYLGNSGGILMWVLEVMEVGRARALE